jgi:2-dehydropantoate 2-reductase
MAAGSDEVSHICVFGVGGVGGYFGGRIAWALARQNDSAWDVHFVARGSHLAKIRSHGLILATPEGRLTCKPASAVASLRQAPTPDVVFVCVKSYDLGEAAHQIAGHCHDDTIIIPLLNGVDIHARLRTWISGGYLLPACVLVGTHLERPGVVSQAGGEGVILMGGDPDRPEFVPQELLSLLDRVGISYRWFDDSRPALWEKFIFISAFGLVTAASGKTLGEVLLDPVLMAEATGIMSEVVELAASEGIDMGPDAVACAVAKANDFPFDTRTSLQRDVEAGGRNEGDLFGGAILRLGAQNGVPTPQTGRLYSQSGWPGGTAECTECSWPRS